MSLERIEKLVGLAREHEPALADWLLDALESHKSGCPLDDALGISQAAARSRRDAALRRAAELIHCASEWETAKRLSAWIAWVEEGGSRPPTKRSGRTERFINELQDSGITILVDDDSISLEGFHEDPPEWMWRWIRENEDEIIDVLTSDKPGIERAILAAKRSGARLPTSPRQIYRVITDK